MALNASGVLSGELRYRAWGETRYTWGTVATKYRFTGQREESTIGLYFYNARWYDPALGRFIQADSIVPEPGNPQALNRYSYVYNNPLRYTDPTGHCVEKGNGICDLEETRLQLIAVRIMSHPLYPQARLATAKMIYHEQRGESREFQAAAGHVAWNRAEHRLENVISVLSEPNQFQGYQGPHVPVPEPTGGNAKAWKTIYNKIVPDVLTGRDPNPTSGARFFANIPPDEEITYADTLARMVQDRFPADRLSRNQALARAGYDVIPPREQGHPLFVYNRIDSVSLDRSGRVLNPLQPLDVTTVRVHREPPP